VRAFRTYTAIQILMYEDGLARLRRVPDTFTGSGEMFGRALGPTGASESKPMLRHRPGRTFPH